MKTYPLALDLRDGTSAIIIRSITSTRIATFPIDFVQCGGDNTWAFILEAVQELVESQIGLLFVLKDSDGGSLFRTWLLGQEHSPLTSLVSSHEMTIGFCCR